MVMTELSAPIISFRKMKDAVANLRPTRTGIG
uniref:Uncharacterized protein n=1 Tax=Oryza meridionalis TaxID=40149 RepID=A0A0E0CUU8_9ORYZ